jgi:hypothetical protein
MYIFGCVDINKGIMKMAYCFDLAHTKHVHACTHTHTQRGSQGTKKYNVMQENTLKG